MELKAAAQGAKILQNLPSTGRKLLFSSRQWEPRRQNHTVSVPPEKGTGMGTGVGSQSAATWKKGVPGVDFQGTSTSSGIQFPTSFSQDASH